MVEIIKIFYIIILSLKLVTLAVCATQQSDDGGSCTLHSSDAKLSLYSWLLPTPVDQLPETFIKKKIIINYQVLILYTCQTFQQK
jgi:hypothetical protein